MKHVLSPKGSYAAILALALYFTSGASARAIDDQTERPIEARDAIEMTQMADAACPFGAPTSSDAVQFSPDNKRFFFVLTKGNLEQNVNEYSLQVVESENLHLKLKARTLVKMRSSDQPAITDACWMKNSRTIVFLGANREGNSAIYSLDISTRRLRRLTPSSTSVLRYALTENETEIIYISRKAPRPAPNQKANRDAPFTVQGQSLVDLLSDKEKQVKPAYSIYTKFAGQPPRRIWEGSGSIHSFLSISPNGRYVVFCKPVLVRELSKEWSQYDYGSHSALIEPLFRTAPTDTIAPFQKYWVIDLFKHTTLPLWDGPRLSIGFLDLKWSADERSVFLHQVFLPHQVNSSSEQRSFLNTQFDVEVDLVAHTWSPRSNVDWTKGGERLTPLKVSIEQDLNSAPRLIGIERATGKTLLSIDLNPEFDSLRFGDVSVITWKVHGIDVTSGLYLPTNYDAHQRYPLVIQTHGFRGEHFSMDGNEEWSSAFAARLLAARGIAALQTYKIPDHDDYEKVSRDESLGHTPEERFRTFASLVYEGAVKELDRRGVIDPTRVGISGFSRTVWFVKYTLTHSAVPFKAALLVDGIDSGYFSYLAFEDTESEIDNGGLAPFSQEGFNQWRLEAPGFNLDRVACPVRLVSFDFRSSLLLQWEWFAGLRLLNKPVELTVFPHASHILTKPLDRYRAMQGMVDWFASWLQSTSPRSSPPISIPSGRAAMKSGNRP